MTDEEKANLLKEADTITSKELAYFELAWVFIFFFLKGESYVLY